jgi:hypothetical protein
MQCTLDTFPAHTAIALATCYPAILLLLLLLLLLLPLPTVVGKKLGVESNLACS